MLGRRGSSRGREGEGTMAAVQSGIDVALAESIVE